MEKQQILIPIEFTEKSHKAIEQSYNLAKLTGCEITLLHVIQTNNSFFDFISKEESVKLAKEMEVNIHHKLALLAEMIEDRAGVKVNTIIEKGKIYEKILEISEKINVRYILMAKKGSNVSNRFISTKTMMVIREAKVPVLTVADSPMLDGCKMIILPLDLTKETTIKVSKAIEIANRYNAAISVVSVMDTTDEYELYKLNSQIERVKEVIMGNNIACTAEIIKKDKNNLADTLLNYAKNKNADLLIIMTQQEKNWTRFFVGSTAQEIIRLSDIPILSIVPK
ncbi:MAG: hypothetical protein A2X12_07825 [Bacteroidetes bacterium GWE2_29_8]|nr:MAG: hypothetical protein A2X12_07825 [Bacteroidetes bacterium GWE2_29_8]OFY25321.1 MAG: hypothetical protein A2X02_09945 [Bacteroidetes bacterium GWF2_29_10]